MPEFESEQDPHRKCGTCNNSWLWHQSQRPMHPFNDGQAGATAFLKKRDNKSNSGDNGNGARPPDPARFPMDPVLRLVLIELGVITPAHLRQAEEVIRATAGQFDAVAKESRENGQ